MFDVAGAAGRDSLISGRAPKAAHETTLMPLPSPGAFVWASALLIAALVLTGSQFSRYQRILEGDAFRVMFLNPTLGNVDVGEYSKVVPVPDRHRCVHVNPDRGDVRAFLRDFHQKLSSSTRFAAGELRKSALMVEAVAI